MNTIVDKKLNQITNKIPTLPNIETTELSNKMEELNQLIAKSNQTIEKSLEKLIARTKKPSFNNNKGLTKIKQYIILDSIDFIQQVLNSDNSTNSLNEKINK